MRNFCLLVLVLMVTQFGHGGVLAQSADSAAGQTSAKSTVANSSGHARDDSHAPASLTGASRANGPDGQLPSHRVSTPNMERGHATAPIHSTQNARLRPQLGPGAGANFRPVRSDRIAVAGKSAAGSSQSLRGAQHVRVSSTARPVAAPANMVRHRSPNPAVVTGRVSSVGRNTGGIDGSRIKGKT